MDHVMSAVLSYQYSNPTSVIQYGQQALMTQSISEEWCAPSSTYIKEWQRVEQLYELP